VTMVTPKTFVSNAALTGQVDRSWDLPVATSGDSGVLDGTSSRPNCW
jgi:hypothetical protein